MHLHGSDRSVSKLTAIPHGNEQYDHALSTASREERAKYGDDGRAEGGKQGWQRDLMSRALPASVAHAPIKCIRWRMPRPFSDLVSSY
jgi:hypothetical protein